MDVAHSHELSTEASVPQKIELETGEIHLTQEVEENDQILPTRYERELLVTPSTPLEYSQEPVCGDENFVNSGPLAASLHDVSVDKRATSVLDEMRYSCPDDGGIRTKPKVWCILFVDLCW